MKKAGKITLGVLGAAAVLLGAGAVWQWNNVKAAAYTLTENKAALEAKLDENRQVLKDTMKDYQIQEYSFSPEEMEQLTTGELDPSDAAARLLESSPEPSSAPSPAPSQAPAFQPSAPPAVSYEAEEEEIRQLIATMYVLQATYEGKLEAVVQEAIDEYAAGEHTDQNRTDVVYSKFDKLTAMEKDCDAQVAAVVSRLRELLKATGRDDSLAKQVEDTYQEEKSLKKAYYIREFQEG